MLPITHRRKERPVRIPHWIENAAIVVCCVLLTGCSFSLWNTKTDSETKKPGEPRKNLVKPSITAEREIGPSVKVPHNREGEPEEDKNEKGTASEKKSGESLAGQKDGAGQREDESSGASGGASDEADGSFKKHDHSKYKGTIKNAAIDTLNTHRGAAAARLCRDETTDLWTLSIYKQGGGRMSFVIYFWDEIDGKWDRSFESGNVPLKKWKDHLRHSSAGKTCEMLKGAHLFEGGERR
ncbi:MAG: hypothetical protein V1792_26590 [Pseudomonadota bacterium]